MKTSQHTPGPWSVGDNGASIKVVDPEDKAVCMVIGRKNGWNADLISAAPELLSALCALLEDHQRMFPEAHPTSAIKWEECSEVQQAQAAIAKATN